LIDQILSAKPEKTDPEDLKTFRNWMYGIFKRHASDPTGRPITNPHPPENAIVACYAPPCSNLAKRENAATYRADQAKLKATLRAEQIEVERQEAARRRQQALRAHGRKLAQEE